MDRVTKDQWKTLGRPKQHEPLDLNLVILDSEAEIVLAGLRPSEMEDKWFIYSQDGWLYFHRSWTGAMIYWLKLEGSPAGARVTKSYVSRQPEQYKGDDLEYDRELCGFLINRLLLKKDVAFPIRQQDTENVANGAFQHHLSGSGVSEIPAKGSKDGSWISRLLRQKSKG